MLDSINIKNIIQQISPYIGPISLLVGMGSFILTLFIYIQAKKISKRFLDKGVYRTPSFGIEVIQNDIKLRITGINEKGQSSNKVKARRKALIFCIPKKVFDFYKVPEKQRYLYLKVLKMDENSQREDIESMEDKEIFVPGEGSADYAFASNVMFLGESFMVFDRYRVIEQEDYFFHLYFNTFMYPKDIARDIKNIEKGRYCFIFGIKDNRVSGSKYYKEFLEIIFN